MSTATDVTICSNALLMLGAKPINALDEAQDRARIASNLFEPKRDALLRSHPWNCAVRRVQLAPEVETPAFDWAFQFLLPGDFMKVLAVGEAGCEVDYRIETNGAGKGVIVSDDNPCSLRYIWRNTNVGTWDDMLVEAMTLTMAAAMAYPITQSATLRDSMRDELERFMRRAKAVDGQDDPPETLGDSPLLQSRFGSIGTGNIWRR